MLDIPNNEGPLIGRSSSEYLSSRLLLFLISLLYSLLRAKGPEFVALSLPDDDLRDVWEPLSFSFYFSPNKYFRLEYEFELLSGLVFCSIPWLFINTLTLSE